MHRLFFVIFLIFFFCGSSWGQTEAAPADQTSKASVSIPLVVPQGTPLLVVLDKELRIRSVAQPVQGKIAEPVYAYDKLVVPVGSQVTGKVSRIGNLSARERTVAALDANFSPAREIQIEFDELVLPDGRRIPLQTVVSPASQGVLQFAAATEAKTKGQDDQNGDAAKKYAAKKVSEARQEIGQDWEAAKKQVMEPGKMHRLERIAVAELPYHPQYMEAGTRFNAELQKPLDFGHEDVPAEMVRAAGSAPPSGSVVHALLLTPLSSADSQKGALVEAIVTQPLLASGHLILPQGTRIRGSVLQVRPARRMKRNGLLRIVFHQIVPPDNPEQQVEASLEGVEAKSEDHLTLDSEGGAQATTSKARYLTTGISLALAAWSSQDDDLSARASGGASGFRVIGLAVGLLVRSRPAAFGFGVYGASMSVYSHFLTRGRDVVYPKDTAMMIGIGTRVTPAGAPPENRPL